MARPLRIKYERATYHVYSRGNRKDRIFLDDSAFHFFVDKLKEGAQKFRVEVHAFCVMGNHFHLLITTPDANISQFMHFLLSSYASYLVQHGWVGHVFAGRYSSLIVKEDEYLRELTRYIHLNPVKAGLAFKPEDYPWSSYRSYAAFPDSPEHPWLEINLLLSQFHHDPVIARELLVGYVLEGLQGDCAFPGERAVARAVLGSEEFVDEVRGLLSGKRIPSSVVGRKELLKMQGLKEVYEAVLEHYKLETLRSEPWGDSLDRKLLREARSAFVFLAREHTIATNGEIARMLGDVGETAISHKYRKTKELISEGTAAGEPLSRLDQALKEKRRGSEGATQDSVPDPN